ncbi:MAG: hypothetical protein ACOX9R_08120 [Armatimonadota bacterium]|jgi:hypothetical protein
MYRPVIMCAAVALAMCAGGAVAADLLVNPGFEEIDAETGFPAGWEPMYWSRPRGTIEAANVARSGERSVVVRGIPEDQITDEGGRNNHLVAQTIELTGMRRLTLTVNARTEGDGRAYLSMMTHDADGNRLQYSSTGRYRELDEWREIVWSFTTEAETARLQIFLRNEGPGAVYFDDVSLSSPEDVLDSGAVAAIVDPLIGGRISSLKALEEQREMTPWRGVAPGGLTAMIVPGDAYPGVLRDLPWEIEVIEPNRRLTLRRTITGGDLAGLTFEKTLSLAEGSATVRCEMTVRNEADAPRTLNLRTQDCLPPGQTTFTWPTGQGLRVYHHPEHILKRAVEIESFAGDWIAATDADGNGMVLRFDGSAAEKGHLYLSHEFDTMEVYYRPTEIAAGESWRMSYELTPITGAGGVVHAADEIALSLEPLALRAETDYAVMLHALGAEAARQIVMRGTLANGDVEAFEDTFEASALAPARVELPWAQVGVIAVELEVEGSDAPVVIAQETLDDSPLRDLPEPPLEVVRFPALERIFSYGEYYRGYIGELGPVGQYREDQLDSYRRGFFNTLLISDNIVLNQFAEGGTSSIIEQLRERDMRVFLRGEYLRVFERGEDGGIRREMYPGDYTREAAVERIESAGHDLETRRRFAEAFSDTILAYDVSDEPGPEHIHNYMMIQSVFGEVDPDHPALTILNFSRTEYLPYMPVYYGDEYPIRNTGRDPWMVMDVVQFASQRAPGPVWLMAQAFGGLPEYRWQLPTGPEMRLMLWGAIAGGCKGITFHGSFSPPSWRINRYYFTTAIDSFGATTPAWEAMVDVGREITAIGPSMLDCAVDTSGAFTVECEQLEDYRERYTGPAVRLGLLRQPGADGGRFLVAVNQDLDRARSARLGPDPGQIAEDAVLVDLLGTMEPMAARAGLELTLEPGDGRILFCGTPAQVGEVVEAVRAGHEANLRQIFEMDARIARAGGVDVAAAAALAERGRSGEAIEALDRAEGMAVVRERIAALDEALALLTPIAHTFREHFDVVVPAEDRTGVARDETWRNTQDPLMQQYADEVAEAFIDRIMLMRRVKAGEAAETAGEVAALVERARRLNEDAIGYVREKAGG